MDCIFCGIIDGVIPSVKVYEDDLCLAINDINPQAPVHVLLFPKAHIQSVNEINSENSSIVSHIFEAMPKIAEKLGLSDGYRVISNCGKAAGQTVLHLHFHIIGGGDMSEKIV